jgi:spermidine synthase
VQPNKPAPDPAPLSPFLRRYLYVTAATTGAAVMVVEILGAKMLAPYVGTSHFVWTAQIAVTLVALAAGYYAGGKMVDKSLQLGRIYSAVLGAAIYLGFSVLVVEPVANWCLNFNLAAGSLMASAFLFFIPLALLAMVGPFFVRVLSAKISDVGGNAGRLISISTLGSFVGTILIGYVLIPRLPNSTTMYITSAVLIAVAAGYFFLGAKLNAPAAIILVMAIILGLLLGGAGVAQDRMMHGATWREVYRANSNFGRLQVIHTDGGWQFYMDDFLNQDIYDSNSKKSLAAFTYMLHDLARAYDTNIHDVLCLGLGVGIVPMQFAREGARVDAVEINPAVLPVAEKYFDFQPSLVHITIDDARHFLNRCDSHYDAIILDAFVGDSSPSHLFSRQAFEAMRRVLNPGGVLVINSFGNMASGRDFFPASLEKTLRSVFRSVTVHGTGVEESNIYFAASDSPDLKLDPSLLPPIADVPELCRDGVAGSREISLTNNPTHGIVLTDDYNPVEYYDAANREALRKRLAASALQLAASASPK